MTILMLIIISLLTVVFGIAIFNVLTGPMLGHAFSLVETPLVSILVPARNEEKNITACLTGLSNQLYKNYEVIVLDDFSEDKTGEKIAQVCHKDQRIRMIDSNPLPNGWTGKNWACHQLSQRAKGKILIFTDADNRHSPKAVSNTVGWIQHLNLGLFSAFPQQTTITLVEKLVIPVIDLFVYAGLPLWLTYLTKHPSLAAANGQWIAFTRQGYEQIGGHKSISNEVVEDVEFSRLAKRKGVKILTTAGTGVVFGRMYESSKQVWEGFSKNIFGLVKYKTIPFFILVVGLFSACILPYLMLPLLPQLALTAVSINILLRFIVSVKYKHSLLTSVILHPIGVGLTLLIAFNSFLSVKQGVVQWKGREIDVRAEK